MSHVPNIAVMDQMSSRAHLDEPSVALYSETKTEKTHQLAPGATQRLSLRRSPTKGTTKVCTTATSEARAPSVEGANSNIVQARNTT